MKWQYMILALILVGGVLSFSSVIQNHVSTPPRSTFNGSPSPSPAIDGSYWNGTGNCGTTGYTNCSAILTTTSSPDLVVVFGQTESAQPNTCSGLPPIVSLSSVTDTSGLTWHLRTEVTSSPELQSGWCYQFHIEEWYGRANSTLTGDKVEVHDSSGLLSDQHLMLLAFGVTNIDQAHPFDPNPNADCTSAGAATTFSCDVSTSNSNDLIIGGPDFFFGSFSYGTGYQAISPAFAPDCQTQVDVSCSEYQSVSTAESGFAVSYTQATSAIYVLIGDAIQGSPGSSSSTTTTTSSSSSSTADSVWWVGASSTGASALPNTGVEADIQVIDPATSSSQCLALWVADALTNDEWGQVGYYACAGDAPVSFYQVWNLGSDTILGGGTGSIAAGTHDFSMYLQSGTTWAYAVDGTVLGTFDMGASTSSASYPVEAFSEEQAGGVFAFSAITFSNIESFQSGSWGAIQTAVSYGTAWGIQGNLQNSGLPNGEIIVGGSVGVISAGTPLWNSGSSSTSSSTTTSMAPPTVTVTVTSTVTQTSTQTSTTTLPGTTTTVTTTAPPVTTTQTVTQTSTSTSTQTLPGTTTTQTVTQTSTSTSTTTISGSTTTVTSTSPPVTSTQTVTQTSTTTSTQTLPGSTSTTTVTSTAPPVTTTQTSTQTVTHTTTSTQTLPGTTTTTTVTATTPPVTTTQTVTQTSTSTTTLPASTTTTTVTSTSATGTTTKTVIQTSTQTSTVTIPASSTTTTTVTIIPPPVTTTQTSTSTTTLVSSAVQTITSTQTVTLTLDDTNSTSEVQAAILAGNTTTVTLPASTTTVTSPVTTTSTVNATQTVTDTLPPTTTTSYRTVTVTTTVCVSSSSGQPVSCPASDESSSNSGGLALPISSTSAMAVLMGSIAVGAGVVFAKRAFDPTRSK